MNPSTALLNTGMVTGLFPLAAVFLRPRSRFIRIGVGAASMTSIVFLFLLVRALHSTTPSNLENWVYALVAATTPLLLGGYLLSAGISREHPEESFRILRRTFALIGFVGAGFLVLLRHPSFLTGVQWVDGVIEVRFGALGKAYLSYLLVGIVFIGYNLESTYRTAPSGVRQALRFPFLALFALLGYLTYALTVGILYAHLDSQQLAAAAVPFVLAHLFLAYGLVRGSLTDRGAPVSRSVVYSSFTALAAGLYVFAIGAVAQISQFTHWSPDQVVTLTLGFLAVLLAVLFFVSNRFQRRVRRYIDRNFYVNRYDYRAQWSRVTQAMDEAQDREAVLGAAQALLREVFLADQVTIAVRGEMDPDIRPHLGKGRERQDTVLRADSPLYRLLAADRRSLLIEQRPHDFEYIPIYAENQEWLEQTASRVVGPLFFGADLVGTLGVERAHADDPFTFEDVALLDSIAGHVASALRAVELSEALAQSREMEVMSHWSNMILHDLKNYLAPLRMIAQNLETQRHKPNIAEVAAKDLNRVAGRMESLVRTLSELRENPELSRRSLDLNALVQETVDDLRLPGRDGLRLQLELRSTEGVIGDPGLLRRVLENLLTNAVEAMDGHGSLTVSTQTSDGTVLLSVTDTGCGMSEEYIRERLFRPFATTKRQGLGLGLYQCRSIIKSHGGTIRVESRPGSGSSFHVALTATPVPEPELISVTPTGEEVSS
jgi:putative PEP-CTERM system histidine kinase